MVFQGECSDKTLFLVPCFVQVESLEGVQTVQLDVRDDSTKSTILHHILSKPRFFLQNKENVVCLIPSKSRNL